MGVQVMNIPSPAFYGLAKSRAQSPMGPEWAVKLKNIVVDTTGRIAAREGYDNVNTDVFDSGANVVQIHEYVNAAGASEIISATTTKLWSGTTTPADKTGTVAFTDGNWKFINFNGYCLGWKSGEAPIQYNGSGNFALITGASGTVPDGNTAHAAFGRVWALDDDKQTIRYCALLDHTRWDAADGGGLIDMRSVWTQGMDEVIAITSLGSSLVVFGKRHIIIWVDGAGSQLGIDPDEMYVTDAIEGAGAISRDAVVNVGEIDVAFWSTNGVRSLVRTVQERATPINELSPGNRDYVVDAISTGTLTKIRSVYSPSRGLILFSHPDFGKVLCFDARQPLPEGGYRMTEWEMAPKALANTIGNVLYLGFAGIIASYGGYNDNGASYQFEFESGWIDIKGEESRKQALKALRGFLQCVGDKTVTIRWWPDFSNSASSVTVPLEGADAGEWGIGEWGTMEWGGSVAILNVRIPLRREAEYFKFAVVVQISNGAFAMQPFTLYTKPMRLA